MTTETDINVTPLPNRADRRKASAEARKKANAEQEGAAVAPIEPRRVWVVYVYDDAEGFERHDRMWVTGVADLRTLEGLLQTEKVIEEQKKQLNVRIINWKPLEG